MNFKHIPYNGKLELTIEEFETFDKYHFYVRMGPPIEQYEDTEIWHQSFRVSRPIPEEVVDRLFEVVKISCKEYLKTKNESK